MYLTLSMFLFSLNFSLVHWTIREEASPVMCVVSSVLALSCTNGGKTPHLNTHTHLLLQQTRFSLSSVHHVELTKPRIHSGGAEDCLPLLVKKKTQLVACKMQFIHR